MKKFIAVILISIFSYSTSYAFIKGKGELKMTDRALNHLIILRLCLKGQTFLSLHLAHFLNHQYTKLFLSE